MVWRSNIALNHHWFPNMWEYDTSLVGNATGGRRRDDMGALPSSFKRYVGCLPVTSVQMV
jgi:hypothetical protein